MAGSVDVQPWGRCRTVAMTDEERREWAHANRDAKLIIGSLLALQVLFLLTEMLRL